ncbi:MAG: zinc dependent phospholipase C family protein [Candidatus Faecisoma sp.]|nr:zinc dependent phospholipase C family protein [Acholeplasma sp.]MDY2892229.1 zinc dependent phospholipase C family protein [Candidatus Faecisoma sp.]
MASAVIHLCVATLVSQKTNKRSLELLIGSIAPDIAKYIGENKMKTHFQDYNNDLPNLKLFLDKYSNYMNDDFVLGYYIHLYTDYLWYKYFMNKYLNNNYKLSKKEFVYYLYNDYTNLNVELIEDYNITLDIFYNEIPLINNIIEEIPMNKINIIIDEMGKIIKNSKKNKTNILKLKEVELFIDLAKEAIYNEVKLWL